MLKTIFYVTERWAQLRNFIVQLTKKNAKNVFHECQNGVSVKSIIDELWKKFVESRRDCTQKLK